MEKPQPITRMQELSKVKTQCFPKWAKQENCVLYHWQIAQAATCLFMAINQLQMFSQKSYSTEQAVRKGLQV